MGSADGYVVIKTELDTKSFEFQIKSTESKLNKLVEQYKKIENQKPFKGQEEKLISLQEQIEKTQNKLIDLRKQQENLSNISGVENQLTGLNNTVTRAFTSLKRTIIGLGIFSLVRRMFDFGDAVSRVDTINNYARVMSNLGISGKEAEASIKRLSDALMGLPTTLDDAAIAVQKFTSKNSNIKASTEMFLAANNAILAGGASMQQQATAMYQLSDAYAKGKPDMMDWRSIMTAMPAQLTQIAKAMGYIDADQLGQALRGGTVSMNEFMITMIKLNKQGLNGFKSFEEQARNSTGGIRTSITNLKTAITRALADIMNAVGQANIAEFFNNIAKAISKAVPYIAGFVKAILMLFGINNKKQADDTAESFNNLGASVSSTTDDLDDATGAAKSLNKELKGLSSFDEMNVLADKSSTDSSSGTGVSGGIGGGLGDLDFGDFETNLSDVADKTQEIANKIVKFLKPIKDNWEEIVGAILGAKSAFFLLNPLVKEFGLNLGIIKALGIGIAIAGITIAIINLIKFLKDKTFENFIGILEGIAVAVVGVAIAVSAWPVAVAAAIALIIVEIVKNYDKIINLFNKGIEWLKGPFRDKLKKTFGPFGDLILQPILAALKMAKSSFESVFGGFKKIINGIVLLFKGDFKNGIKSAFSGLKSILLGPINALRTGINTLIDGINRIKITAPSWLPLVGGKKIGFNIPKIPKLARGTIVNAPGRGVPTPDGRALYGEAGPEAYLPLSDTQLLEQLGSTIGKYININATIPVQIGNRLVAREIKRINAENDFAFNR